MYVSRRTAFGLFVAVLTMMPAAASAAQHNVSNAAGLQAALSKVNPGDIIVLAAGTYRGSFVASRSGSLGKPITLQGPATAVLTNSDGYGFSLRAHYWKLSGFTVDGASKGIVLDNARNNRLDGLTVKNIHGEGIHFRTFSKNNVLSNSTIRDTGLGTPGWGEGVYIGSASSNWRSLTGGHPDASDGNCVADNRIGPNVRAEGIDIKEGTSGGIIVGNTYDATGLSGENYATGFLNAKGNGYLVYGNTVTNTSDSSKLQDGFQTYTVYPGYGRNNTFQANTVNLNAAGYGFNITAQDQGNKVCDSNQVTNALSGVSNTSLVACSDAKPECPDVLHLPRQ